MFDLLFNIPSENFQKLILHGVIGETDVEFKQTFMLLLEAFDKIDSYQFGDSTDNPMIQALLSALMISNLENEESVAGKETH